MLKNSATSKREAVAEFLRREGLIYRKWIPKGWCMAFQVEQLVLPKYGIRLAHMIPLASYLGKEKTSSQILKTRLIANSVQRPTRVLLR